MKKCTAMLLLLCMLIVTAAYPAPMGGMEADSHTELAQGPAINPAASRILTIASTIIDMSGQTDPPWLWWELYTTSTGCKFRMMKTGVKPNNPASNPLFTVPDSMPAQYIVNKKEGGFANYTNCALAELKGG